jgi:acyl-CoA thioester hydrolase
MPAHHTMTVRIYYEDTDFSGVVYHANYLRFFERARTELLRASGLHHRALFAGNDTAPTWFVVRSMTIDFRAPARMDDLLMIETSVAEIKGASALLEQRALRDDEVLVTAAVRVAVVANGKPVRLPEDVRQSLIRARGAAQP